jgi:hypothetical protein
MPSELSPVIFFHKITMPLAMQEACAIETKEILQARNGLTSAAKVYLAMLQHAFRRSCSARNCRKSGMRLLLI